MILAEIKKKIRQIQIRTRFAVNGSLVGNFNSFLKGTGHEFDQIREYQPGDDIRFVDWNSSARMNKLLVRQYFEEKNRNIIIMVDISGSLFFSCDDQYKFDLVAQVASVLTLVAQYGKDNVGLVFFSDQIDEVIPPASGKIHEMNLMKKLFEIEPTKKLTNLNIALEFAAKKIKRNSIVFLLSDFIDSDNYEKNLRAVTKKCDLIFIKCIDKNEEIFPEIGLINVQDVETGEMLLFNSYKNKNFINNELKSIMDQQNKIFKKYKINLLNLNKKDFLVELVCFFKRIMSY